MRRRSSSYSCHDAEKEREKRRKEWIVQQQKEREHERLKRKKIEEYERKRAELLGINHKRRSPCRSRSKSRSRSRSEELHHRSRLKSTRNNKLQIMSEKINTSEGNKPFFKGPDEAPKINADELHQITVKILRKIPAPATETSEIRRDVLNPEEITLKRREGAKPIFDREELKRLEVKSIEIEEHRTIQAVQKTNPVKSTRYTKRRSTSLSPRRHRSPTPHAHSSSKSYTHRSRREEYSKYVDDHHRHKNYKTDRHYSDSRERSREDSKRRRPSRERSYSRERDHHKLEHEYSRSSRGEKEYREYRERSKDRSYERRERRHSSRERRPIPQYVEPVPYPVYYGEFMPRPMLVGPTLPPIRGPIVRGRLPLAPLRPPYPPRFIGPQDMFRAVLPPDPRFGRMY